MLENEPIMITTNNIVITIANLDLNFNNTTPFKKISSIITIILPLFAQFNFEYYSFISPYLIQPFFLMNSEMIRVITAGKIKCKSTIPIIPLVPIASIVEN